MMCLIVSSGSSNFFFFQAEDGIRDLTVTGVQTCALPISRPSVLIFSSSTFVRSYHLSGCRNKSVWGQRHVSFRSEERRVGKECRSRGAPLHEKKKREKM